jgi:ankyrin repeat protein
MSKHIGNRVYRHNLYTNACKDVCIFNLQGRSPLHQTASHGHTEVVEVLIAKGADIDCGDNEVSTYYIRS